MVQVKIKLDAGAIAQEYTRRAIKWVNRALPILLQELKNLTPEDTKEMLDSYVVEKAQYDGGRVVWVIGNTAGHAIYVEFGRRWVKFWYHKPKWSLFYVWEGNRTFTRAVDNKREEITKIIFDSIDKW